MMLRARMRQWVAQFSPQDLTAWLWLAGGGAFCLQLLLWPRRGGRRAETPARGTSGGGRGRLAQERAIEHELHTLTHEVAEMVRRAGAQLDAKSARLEQLIRDADQRIAQLQALERAEHAAGGGNGAVARPALPAAIHLSVPSPPPADHTAAAEARHAQVYRLHDDGYAARQIADTLGRPAGEVELILALRPRPQVTPAATDGDGESASSAPAAPAPEPDEVPAEPLG
jgi:hypothetical protein